jgi:hypothetical protein
MIAARMTFILLAAGAASSVGCHRQPVLTTPESDESGYAAEYPERLRELRTRFVAEEEKTRKSLEGLRALPRSVPASNADELEQVVQKADAAGRSQRYVDEALRQEEVDALMSENRSAIRRRIAGSVAFAAKEKECLKEDVDALAGTAASATDRAVDRQLEERLRARNPAHQYLRAHADELGEQRVNSLERQADTLTRASFVANVRLELYRLELEDLLDREKAVRTTLERDEADGRAALGSTTLSKTTRLALEEQVARDEAARLALPTEVSASKNAEQDMEARAEALKNDYRSLIVELEDELRRRQTEQDASTPATTPVKAPATVPATPATPPATPAPATSPATPAPAAPVDPKPDAVPATNPT